MPLWRMVRNHKRFIEVSEGNRFIRPAAWERKGTGTLKLFGLRAGLDSTKLHRCGQRSHSRSGVDGDLPPTNYRRHLNNNQYLQTKDQKMRSE